ELYARAKDALRMPPTEAWETFPFEGELRPRPLLPPVERERPRLGEGGVDCRRCAAADDDYLWTNKHWRLWHLEKPTGLPLIVILESRGHYAGGVAISPTSLRRRSASCSAGSSARSGPSATSAASTFATGAMAVSTCTGGSWPGPRVFRSCSAASPRSGTTSCRRSPRSSG